MHQDYYSIQTRDGIKITYRQVLPPNPKAIVVISHGYAEHSQYYVQLMESFAAQGYAAYALDHRGHGHSEGERGHLDRFEVFLEDLDVFVDFAQRNHPTLPLFMFGHSMGGLISFNYGILYPEKLKGQVFSGAALDRPRGTENIPTFLFKIINIVLKRYKIHPKLKGKTTCSEGANKFSHGDPLLLRQATLGFFYQFACRGVAFAQENAARFQVPSLFLHGTADRIVPCTASQRIFPKISSQDKTLKLYEGLNHELLQEPEGEKVLVDILDWLRERTRPVNNLGLT